MGATDAVMSVAVTRQFNNEEENDRFDDFMDTKK